MGTLLNWLRRLLLFPRWQVVVLLLLLPAEALARAGGGGGYHGGSSHSSGHGGGGGGGGGGGDGGLFQLIFWLLFSHPVVGVPLLIIVAVLIYLYWQNQQTDAGPRLAYRDNPLVSLSNAAAWLASLREHDPNFDENAFYERVKLAFGKIQSAWCMQDLRQVRPFISDGVHERFLLQIAEQRDEGYRDHMDGLRILDLKTTEIESDGIYDEIAVRIRAVSIDYRESLTTGQRISGSRGAEEFIEIWTFVRRRGAVTQIGKPGLIEGNCPNCGAPIEMNQSANCTHCKALLRSGQYDWVLVEITQESEWDGVRHRGIPGIDELRTRDPDLNAAGIEDQASVAFWRTMTAERIGKIDPLRKVASPELCQAFVARMRPQPGQPRVFYADCAVGSVRLLGALPETDGQRVVVEVRWNGKPFAAQDQGPPRQVGQEMLFHTLLVFFRKPGSKTDAGKGISSAHCPNCGAPESGGTSNACDFCGTVLTDGAHGWVLTEFLPRIDPRGQAILAQLHSSAPPQQWGRAAG